MQPWRGWHPFESFQREIDRMFDGFGRGWGSPARNWLSRAPFENGSWSMPAVDVAEKDGAYEITAELPGIDEKDVELGISNGVLTIRGEKSEEKEDTRKDYRLSERVYGSFERSFALPEDVDSEKIEASYRKGVLTVKLPKRAGAQGGTKKISIRSG
jgi:HSP20 family protein